MPDSEGEGKVEAILYLCFMRYITEIETAEEHSSFATLRMNGIVRNRLLGQNLVLNPKESVTDDFAACDIIIEPLYLTNVLTPKVPCVKRRAFIKNH